MLNEKLEHLENRTNELEGRKTALEQQLADNEVYQLTSRVKASQAELQAVWAESRESLLQSNDSEQYAHTNNICKFLQIYPTHNGHEADDIEAAHPVINNQRSSADLNTETIVEYNNSILLMIS